MKRIYTLAFLLSLLISTTSYAQKGLSLGVSGAAISTSIINQNTWGNGHEYDYESTFSSFYGFDIGYNFTDNVGIYTGYSFFNLGQKYSDNYDGVNWKRELTFKYNVIPIMFKYTSSQSRVNFLGGIGILYAMMNSADQTWTYDGEPYEETGITLVSKKPFDLGASDVTDRFAKNDIILNLEIGARITLIDNLFLDAMLNFSYGLTDINEADYQFIDKDGNYNPSHNIFGGVKVGVLYVLFGD